MEVPCVRVERERGEETRRRLADAGLLADEFEIEVEEGWLYVPVADPEAVPEDLRVVEREVPERDTQDTPADLLGFEPSYERLGDIAILDEDDPERAREIADAVMASDLPVRTVIDRASKVKGELRVRDWEVLAGDASSGTETVHREYGCEFALDVAEVYFSPRLATERHRVAEQVCEGRRPSENASGARRERSEGLGEANGEAVSGQGPRAPCERAFDMFAGVGPFAIPFAKRGAEVVGVDLNERAVEYLRENARRNGVEDRVTAIQGDVRDVVAGSSRAERSDGVRDVVEDYRDWADRIVMNLPHSADEFLDAAVALAGDDCVLHYYDIQHEGDPFGPGEAAIRAAAEPEYEVAVETRHPVRSYAPHELNVCLDVRLTR
ncbi:class I SAM-dependent methyltransferase family protein [Halorussus salilacus]|uniref:class I SAM-dependent methyltransferase n=1 Tax=Halorussus salilacus TaxID=2953750 RepID=UPI0020A1EA77|nr:class I SAM-dependent methyltransferase family protein [Halorussus salilacus]USZ68615.1 class I SAM-dependent methyltransferase family protein [Halorussus salilacus]